MDDRTGIDGRWALTRGQLAVDRADLPEAITGGWQEVAVPYNLPLVEEPFVSVWYRFAVDIPRDDQTWGVYVDVPRANVDLFLDDVRLSSTGPNRQPLAYYTEPILTTFDSRLAAPAGNSLYVHLTRERHNAGSGRIFLAPVAELAAHYDAVILLSQTVPGVVAAFLITMVLLLGVLAVLRREEPAFGWLALTLLLWTMHSLSQLVDHIPIDHWLWFGIVYALNAWVLTVVVVFNRFYGFHARKVEIFMWATTLPLLVGVAWVSFSGDQDLMDGFCMRVWLPYVLLWALYTLFQHGYAIRRGPDFENLGLMLHGLTAMVLGMRDYLFDIGVPWVPGTTYYLPIYAAFSIAFLIFLLARRFILNQRRIDGFTAELKRQVDETSHRLEENYRALSKLERRQAITQERGRIMRDMHDGLGGQLVHALALADGVEPGNAASPDGLKGTIQRALQDLRFIIDSLSPEANDLTALLASFRHRSTPILEQASIRIRWNVGDLPRTPLAPAEALHLLRILQEVVTNTIRHAQASTIEFRTTRGDGKVEIEVCDNGLGFAPETVTERGLSNLRHRAAEIGASIRVESGTAGTCVTIGLPDREHGKPG